MKLGPTEFTKIIFPQYSISQGTEYFTHLYSLQDGVYVRGMYLQGAGWDTKNANLVEAEPMQLVCPMPTIHFKPVEGKRKTQKGNMLH